MVLGAASLAGEPQEEATASEPAPAKGAAKGAAKGDAKGAAKGAAAGGAAGAAAGAISHPVAPNGSTTLQGGAPQPSAPGAAAAAAVAGASAGGVAGAPAPSTPFASARGGQHAVAWEDSGARAHLVRERHVHLATVAVADEDDGFVPKQNALSQGVGRALHGHAGNVKGEREREREKKRLLF